MNNCVVELEEGGPARISVLPSAIAGHENASWSPEELFHGNWADEVEQEEREHPNLLALSSDSTCRIADKRASAKTKRPARKTKPKKKKSKKKKVEYKIFVGGIIFADLEERLFEMEEAIGEEMEDSIMFAACDTLKQLRIDCFVSMFEEFGKVQKIKPNWEKRFCHVSYAKEEEALEAYRVLARSNERKRRQKEFKDSLAAAGFPRFAAPNFNFYVGWPRGSVPSSAADPVVNPDEPQFPVDNLAENQIAYWMLTTASDASWGVLNAPTRSESRLQPNPLSASNGKGASTLTPTPTTAKTYPLASHNVIVNTSADAAPSNLCIAA